MLEIGDTLLWVISGPQQLGRAFKSATHLGQHRAGIIPSPFPVPSFPVRSRSFCLQSLRRLPGCPSLWMHTFPSRRFGSVLIKASPFICGDNWTFISPGCCSQIYSSISILYFLMGRREEGDPEKRERRKERRIKISFLRICLNNWRYPGSQISMSQLSTFHFSCFGVITNHHRVY